MTRLTNFNYELYLRDDAASFDDFTLDPHEKVIELLVHTRNDQDSVLIMDDLMRCLMKTNSLFDAKANKEWHPDDPKDDTFF